MNTKIVPINYIPDIKEGLEIGIEQMSITYIQPADTCSDRDEVQCITITSQCAESVGKEEAEKQEGFYFNVSIPDGCHWSVDDGDSLKALIGDFKRRLYQTTVMVEDARKNT